MADTEKVLELVKQEREWIVRGREECAHYWVGTGERAAGRGLGQLHLADSHQVHRFLTLR